MRRLTDRLSAVRRDDRGFTLIELLIVIIILGVLAAIVVFSVQGITDRGKTSACDTTKKTVETAYEAYIANSPTGAKPAAWSDLYPNYVHSATQPTGVTITWATGQVSGTC
ncbi:prepilin-type N-terminal cleavage/methylation domain-containing protein [Nocardioides daeguensis]|uniref:Prepilin-type N-terminal cleavage/methylation domain-containing protein n=1 Tax=Nocardioides daeguensis TaxID=908359 RepID=A0ABP6UV44_9ACTN|nr:prepilin-type N-terminal cleavage/methylation domain-containing protein [Nocardioides daeguensis]MBV6725972.1 prepilin-type N-terminal cleavage/methylation domain-containing protein [Nocardioides daeguensis]MCR1772512.1 prepilin-type N-terminal cleavage/methylation domain-containing protein [Nocardioides daeguensis]